MLYFCISINTSFHLKSRKKRKQKKKPLYINNLMIYFIRQITYKVYNIDILSFYHNFFPYVYNWYIWKSFYISSIFYFPLQQKYRKNLRFILFFDTLFFFYSRKIIYILYIYFCFHISLLRFLASYTMVCGLYMVFTFYTVFLILRKVIYLTGSDWTMTILLFRSKYALLIDIFYYYIWFLCVLCFCG